MHDFGVLGPYLIALAMSVAGLCIFIWGVLAGAFAGADQEALRFYYAEVENGGADRQNGE